MKVIIIGATGMLGHSVVDIFAKSDFEIIATTRSQDLINKQNNIKWEIFDAKSFIENISSYDNIFKGANWVINCIGIIKPYIQDDQTLSAQNAIQINSLLPHYLNLKKAQHGFKVIQIATDCVYSGIKGNYLEPDKHDALDVYGKTKSLGEVQDDNFYNLRCSIIGKEQKAFLSLISWFIKQPLNATVNGFTNHKWNGVTTHHFGKLCLGIIKNNIDLPKLHHVVPADIVTKFELLQYFAEVFDRKDITVNPATADVVIDRTISTISPDLNKEMWQSAGYSTIPTILQMITEIK